jgi:hypothetical protein
LMTAIKNRVQAQGDIRHIRLVQSVADHYNYS